MPPPRGAWNPIEGPGDFTTTRTVHNDTYPSISPLTADLSGQSILIVGASRGIGKAIALSFARSGASKIALAARSDLSSVVDEVRAAGLEAGRARPEVLGVKVDIAEQGSVDAGVRVIEEKFGGKLDAVVCNAGILDGRGLVGEADPGAWWRTFEVNVKGPYLIARATLPLLLRSSTRTLITVSSVGAHVVSPSLSAYQTSKLSVVRLMEFIGKEYAEQGVVTISVHPGNVLTDIVNRGEGMDEQLRTVFTETPELAGDTLAFLCRERRGWLSGRYVNCTWDMPELVEEGSRRRIVEGDLLKVRLAVPGE